MVKKAGKPGKRLKKRGPTWTKEDVEVHTGLPPQVDGQLRCYLRFCVNQVLWLIPSSPEITYVRLLWWGETSPGAVFRPLDVKKGTSGSTQTTARYAVRSGPKQFAAYLSDMGSIMVEVLAGQNKSTVGRCQINEIGLLAPNRPINGFFPVFSADSEKIAELQISVTLESLMASYDSTSTIATPDMSVDASVGGDVIHPRTAPLAPVPKPALPTDDATFASPQKIKFAQTSPQRSRNSRRSSPARPSSPSRIDAYGLKVQGQQMKANVRSRPTSPARSPKPKSRSKSPSPKKSPIRSGDLVSTLLARGHKLKEAMIVSALETPSTAAQKLMAPSTDSGRLLVQSIDDKADAEDAAVDLIMGDHVDPAQLQMLRTLAGSPASTISLDDVLSDPGDPLHDTALLEELFYKQIQSDNEEDDALIETITVTSDRPSRERSRRRRNSIDEPGNRRPPSSRNSSCSSLNLEKEPVRETAAHKKVKKKKIKGRGKSRSRSCSSERRSTSPSKSKSKSRKKKSALHDSDSEARLSDSRVSFDPLPSDADDSVQTSILSESKSTSAIDGLSIQRLTLLGRVHVARVTVDLLSLEEPKLNTRNGKPPTPKKHFRSQTYFVEYQFPVVATSRDKYQPNAMATEVMRAASKKVTSSSITFNHHSVFPVLFDEDAIHKWWTSVLIFKVYSKNIGQKVPKLIGMTSVPLKSVIKSESLHLQRELEVRDRSTGKNTSKNDSVNGRHGWPSIGRLKINIELASDSRDFSTALAKTRLAEMTNAKIVPIPQPKEAIKPGKNFPRGMNTDAINSTAGTQTEPQTTQISQFPVPPPQELPPTKPQQNLIQNPQHNVNEFHEPITMHLLLMIPEANDVMPSQPHLTNGANNRDNRARNLFLVCRMVWSDDISSSNVCWGTINPQFNFSQVVPVLLTTSVLERMKNNFVVVEVWDKKTTSEKDQLVGIVKLPLHQFYLSYRDQRITNSLLKAQFPVISIDGESPITSPFTGERSGNLRTLLAMGSIDQVTQLQASKKGDPTAVSVSERPLHALESQQHLSNGIKSQDFGNSMVEHVFELCVESIEGLGLMENMMWGEADCFVQYHFPCSSQGVTTLKSYRSATTLCVPDPVFNDVIRHKIALSEGTPVQREILTACAGVGGGSGGVPFEVWCRFYHPNVRDQVIAKGILPLAKVCAIVTMQRGGLQTFALQLSSLVEPSTGNARKPSGTLNVTMCYKSHVVKADQQTLTNTMGSTLTSPTVCISVSILRASGLKASANDLVKFNPSLQYASDVGVNCYVRTNLSFLPKEDERVTRTVARSFAPDFSCHLDFPCPLLWTEAGNDALSLAEILEQAEATFEIWHQMPHSVTDDPFKFTADIEGRQLASLSGDILLGTVTVSLASLLRRKTGILGWHPVHLPSLGWTGQTEAEDSFHGNQSMKNVVGGLELAIKLAHHDDINKLIEAGRGVGWTPDFDAEDYCSDEELYDGQDAVTISVDSAHFPLVNALITGQKTLDKNALCYVRYKFYDKGAVCSDVIQLEDCGTFVSGDLNHTQSLPILVCAPYKWYLQEERLEIQVWLTHHHGNESQRPRQRDKLIGSAFIDLCSLNDRRRKSHRVSGVFPLFKPGASSLGGACIQAHVSIEPFLGSSTDFETQFESKKSTKSLSQKSPKKQTKKINGFSCCVSIECALRLPLISTAEGSQPPSCYVSYQTADADDLTYTKIIDSNRSPTWNHNNETHLETSLLEGGNQNLVFKVWHKLESESRNPDKAMDTVLGFVSVDLSLLRSGLQQISGWYNIMDFNGSCQGQIKITLTPQENLNTRTSASSAPLRQTAPASVKIPEMPHFSEHYANIEKHHRQLKEKMVEMGSNDVNVASRSILFSTLRKNLEDLDSITGKLKERLDPGKDDHNSSKPLSTSSALITGNFTDQFRTTHEWTQPEGVVAWGQSTTEGESGWARSTGTAEGVSGWVRSSNEHGMTGQISDVAPKDDLFSTQEGSSSTRHDVASAMLETMDQNRSTSLGFDVEVTPAENTENTETDYADTLQKAQTLLKAIGQGTFTPNLIDHEDGEVTPAVQEYEDYDVRPEDDTFAKVWQLRTEDIEHSSLSEHEETLVMQKPLNNVSCANFMNSIDFEEELEEDIEHVGVDQLSEPSNLDFLHSKVDIDLSDSHNTNSVVDRNLPYVEDLAHEDPLTLPKVSRTSSDISSKSSRKNQRKAAAFRREYRMQRDNHLSSSSDEETEVKRSFRNQKKSETPRKESESEFLQPPAIDSPDDVLKIVPTLSVSETEKSADLRSFELNEAAVLDYNAAHGLSQEIQSQSTQKSQSQTTTTLRDEDYKFSFSNQSSVKSSQSTMKSIEDIALTSSTNDVEIEAAADEIDATSTSEFAVSPRSCKSNPTPRNTSHHSDTLSVKSVPTIAMQLEKTLKTLKSNKLPQVIANDEMMAKEKAEAAKKLLDTMSKTRSRPIPPRFATKSRPPPSSEEAQRIAKIFAQKFT